MASTRRMVLLGGAGAAGALIVGYALWPGTRLARADSMAARKDERFLTNWIKVSADDTVTIVIPHCDMGTGIFTALPQMAAEEMDADWDQIRVEQAPADPLFANGALGEGFILTGRGLARDDVPAFLRGLAANGFRTIAEFMNLQTTGGSSAVRATGVFGMQVTGAAARAMLIEAGAARWNVKPEDCSARKGRVYHNASGQSFSFGALAAEAATMTPSSQPRLKTKSAYTIIGQSKPRFDIPAKVEGKVRYGIDVEQPGMLYAAIRIAPVFGGKLKSMHSRAVMNMPGVRKVVPLDDAVVVVADRFWRAKNAADALSLQFSDGGHGNVSTKSIYAQHDTALAGGDLDNDLTLGDGADALSNGRVVEATYRVPYLAHAPMEPMNATALYRKGSLEVWSGTQDGLGSRHFCAKAAGLDLEQVTFHLRPMGGAFGRRLRGHFNFLDYAVKTAMAMPGVPVKLIFTREDDMQHDYYRPTVESRFKAALDSNGTPIAWTNDYTTQDKANPEAHIPYAIPNQSIRIAKVTSHVPTGPWRSVEASWHGFFIESFIDELAHAARKDPVEFRRALLRDSPRHLGTLNLAAEKAGWGRPLAPGRARGVAMFECFKTIVAQIVEIEMGADKPAVKRVVCAADCGMAVNPDGFKAQMEGGIVFGLSAALFGHITLEHGAVAETNFPDYEMVRLADCPQIEVHIHQSDAPLGGAGEPGVPPLAPALANAVFAATGVRVRELPFSNHSLTLPNKQTTSL